MESAKQHIKNILLRKFILLYGLSILAITIVIYFFFNTPAGIFKRNIQNFKSAEIEETQLLNRVETITATVNKIIETDSKYQLAIDVADKEKFKENLGELSNDMSASLLDLENDSVNRKSAAVQKQALNYLFMFRNFLEYRDAFSNDFSTLESGKVSKLQFRAALDSFRSCVLQRDQMKTQLNEAGSKNAASSVQQTNNLNNELANKATLEKRLDDLQTKLKQVQTDLTNCNQEKSSVAKDNAQVAAVNISQQQMASLLVEAGKKIYSQALQGKSFRGGTIEQRAYFACARQVFEEAKSHQGIAEIDDYLKNIDIQLKKLSF